MGRHESQADSHTNHEDLYSRNVCSPRRYKLIV
jgi:hypothetical protein